MFCDGVNRFVFSSYAHQPWLDRRPGMTVANFGIHYERTETWWPYVRPWHEYLARCNNLLRQGLFVADVCCLQTEDVPSCSGYRPQITGLPSDDRDGPPGMVRPKESDYDGCSAESVLTRMRVRRRIVLPDGMSYRLMALPPGRTMTPALLAKIEDLVQAGATVVGPAAGPVAGSDGLSGLRPASGTSRGGTLGRLRWLRDQRAPFRARQGNLGQDSRRSAGQDGRAARFRVQIVCRRNPLYSSPMGPCGRLLRCQRGSQDPGARTAPSASPASVRPSGIPIRAKSSPPS